MEEKEQENNTENNPVSESVHRVSEQEMSGQAEDHEQEKAQATVMTAKRIAAMTGVLLLLLLVIATLVVACIDFSAKEQVFSALLLCDIVIPVFLWFILRFLS